MTDTQADGSTQPTESPTETPQAAPKRKGGRPKKSRGAPISADDPSARWTVRGVPDNVRNMAVKAASIRGMTVGDFVAEAIVKLARSDGKEVSGTVPAATIQDTLQALTERLTKLEQQRTAPGFIARLFGAR